jgi:hypothetical protein
MSANFLVPNDYYTLYCKNIVTSDAPIQTAETWCYYPSNPASQGQVVSNPEIGTQYPLVFNVSAIRKNVVVNVDGSIDIVQSGVYRLECQSNVNFGGNASSASFAITNNGNVFFRSAIANALTTQTASLYSSVFFIIPQGNTTAVKIQVSAVITTGNAPTSMTLLGANLSLQRIDEAPVV